LLLYIQVKLNEEITFIILIILISFIGTSGWTQKCSEGTQLARLSPAMMGSVPTSTSQFCTGSTIDLCEDFDAGASPNNKRLTWTTNTAGGTIDTAATKSGSWACTNMGSYVMDLTRSADNNNNMSAYVDMSSGRSKGFLRFNLKIVLR
jgi:hypothetical protein